MYCPDDSAVGMQHFSCVLVMLLEQGRHPTRRPRGYLVSSSAAPLLLLNLEEGASLCPHAVRSESRQPSSSSHSQCSSREHAGALNPSLSPNFLPEAGSCAGGLSAVKQRVKHACTELALQVSAAWHCFPVNVGNVSVLEETNWI